MHNLASVSSNAIEKQVPLCIMEKITLHVPSTMFDTTKIIVCN